MTADAPTPAGRPTEAEVEAGARAREVLTSVVATTVESLAESIGVTPETMQQRMDGTAPLTASEIGYLADSIGVPSSSLTMPWSDLVRAVSIGLGIRTAPQSSGREAGQERAEGDVVSGLEGGRIELRRTIEVAHIVDPGGFTVQLADGRLVFRITPMGDLEWGELLPAEIAKALTALVEYDGRVNVFTRLRAAEAHLDGLVAKIEAKATELEERAEYGNASLLDTARTLRALIAEAALR